MDEKRELFLRNRQGETLHLYLRKYREGDEEGMIACIRDEYGDTYVKQDFYDPAYYKKEAEKGEITFLAAETEDGVIAGVLILKQFYPKEDKCEIASQIFRKKYRGYGLAMPFFEYGMEILLSRFYSAALCRPVLYHAVTQRLMCRLGLKATGVVLNTFDMECVSHSYSNGRNSKHSYGIQVRAVGKKNAGSLYLPPEHQSFCSRIYESLGVEFYMAQEIPWELRGITGMPVESVLEYKQYEKQSSMEIHISRVGLDLPERMEEIRGKYPLKGRQTVSVFLNCNDPNAVWAYRELEKKGYFFTGLEPLCGRQEYVILHHPGEVEFWLEDYVVTEEFQGLIQYIQDSMHPNVSP